MPTAPVRDGQWAKAGVGRLGKARGIVTSVASPHGDAQLYERWRRALRVRQSGADPKPPQAAAVKSHGGERCGKVGTRFRQVWL